MPTTTLQWRQPKRQPNYLMQNMACGHPGKICRLSERSVDELQAGGTVNPWWYPLFGICPKYLDPALPPSVVLVEMMRTQVACIANHHLTIDFWTVCLTISSDIFVPGSPWTSLLPPTAPPRYRFSHLEGQLHGRDTARVYLWFSWRGSLQPWFDVCARDSESLRWQGVTRKGDVRSKRSARTAVLCAFIRWKDYGSENLHVVFFSSIFMVASLEYRGQTHSRGPSSSFCSTAFNCYSENRSAFSFHSSTMHLKLGP